MVISTHSQPVNSGTINAPGVSKPVTRTSESNGSNQGGDTDDVAISPRNLEALGLREIDSESEATETTWSVRNHILDNPATALAVQANARPEVVFELLQGIL